MVDGLMTEGRREEGRVGRREEERVGRREGWREGGKEGVDLGRKHVYCSCLIFKTSSRYIKFHFFSQKIDITQLL